MSHTGRRVRVFGLAAGVALLAFVIWRSDPIAVGEQLAAIGPSVLWLCAVPLIWRVAAGTGLWLIAHDHGLGWIHAVLIRMGGESLNTLTPFFNLGGEPVKAIMLSRYAPIEEASAIVVLDKTAFWLASMLFMGSGILAGPWVLDLAPTVWVASFVLLLCWVLGSVWFVRMQARGGLAFAVGRLLGAIRFQLSERTHQRLQVADEALSGFWRVHKVRFVVSVAAHLVGRVARTLDIAVAAWLIGVPLGLDDSYFIAAVAMAVNVLFIFLPAALGAAEGGHAILFELFGFAASEGLTVALLRRARTLLMAMLSTPLLAIYRPRRDA